MLFQFKFLFLSNGPSQLQFLILQALILAWISWNCICSWIDFKAGLNMNISSNYTHKHSLNHRFSMFKYIIIILFLTQRITVISLQALFLQSRIWIWMGTNKCKKYFNELSVYEHLSSSRSSPELRTEFSQHPSPALPIWIPTFGVSIGTQYSIMYIERPNPNSNPTHTQRHVSALLDHVLGWQ